MIGVILIMMAICALTFRLFVVLDARSLSEIYALKMDNKRFDKMISVLKSGDEDSCRNLNFGSIDHFYQIWKEEANFPVQYFKLNCWTSRTLFPELYAQNK